jgi:hypothetical protein
MDESAQGVSADVDAHRGRGTRQGDRLGSSSKAAGFRLIGDNAIREVLASGLEHIEGDERSLAPEPCCFEPWISFSKKGWIPEAIMEDLR